MPVPAIIASALGAVIVAGAWLRYAVAPVLLAYRFGRSMGRRQGRHS